MDTKSGGPTSASSKTPRGRLTARYLRFVDAQTRWTARDRRGIPNGYWIGWLSLRRIRPHSGLICECLDRMDRSCHRGMTGPERGDRRLRPKSVRRAERSERQVQDQVRADSLARSVCGDYDSSPLRGRFPSSGRSSISNSYQKHPAPAARAFIRVFCHYQSSA